MLILEGTSLRDVNILGLLLRHLGELGSESREMKSGDFLIEVLGKDVDLSWLVGALWVMDRDLGDDLV